MIREIVGEEQAALYGMIMAFTLQGVFMRTEALREEGMVDFEDKKQRDALIDRLVDGVFPAAGMQEGAGPFHK